jgi:hypothetical protein
MFHIQTKGCLKHHVGGGFQVSPNGRGFVTQHTRLMSSIGSASTYLYMGESNSLRSGLILMEYTRTLGNTLGQSWSLGLHLHLSFSLFLGSTHSLSTGML